MVIMEAMAHGCAILSTSVGDIPYHVKDRENGFLFSKTDDDISIVVEAKEKLTWLRYHRIELKRMEENNINFNVALGIRDRLVEAYREVMRMQV